MTEKELPHFQDISTPEITTSEILTESIVSGDYYVVKDTIEPAELAAFEAWRNSVNNGELPDSVVDVADSLVEEFGVTDRQAMAASNLALIALTAVERIDECIELCEDR